MSGRFARTTLVTVLSAAVIASFSVRAQGPSSAACRRGDWTPPLTQDTVIVRTVPQLHDALRRVRPDTTILLEGGDYRLERGLDIATPRVVIRARGGEPSSVKIHGDSMREKRVGVAISVSAPDVTIADLTVGDVGFHGIQVRGERGASRVTIYNVHILDTGQQLIKGSTAGGPLHADDGTVACSTLEYTDHAPSSYTNGVDVLGGRGWTVRDNVFKRIRGPVEQGWSAGPTVLFWGNSQLTRVERNVIVDSFRGIALGLGPPTGPYVRDGQRLYDHQGGWIQNNVIVNLNSWADEGIEANAARDIEIDHNTVLVEGRLSWSISVRFAPTGGHVRNNLTNRSIAFRNGGHADLQGNVSGARPDWFVNAPDADLRLARPAVPAVDAGVPLADIPLDTLGQQRLSGRAPDAGAYEYQQPTP
jgi:hypothetical protein